MTAEAKEKPSLLRRAMSGLWDFVQSLENAGSGYYLDQLGFAQARIRELERDVAELKARRPT